LRSEFLPGTTTWYQLQQKGNTMSDIKKEPIATLRAGAIKASIWENQSEKGVFYTTTYDRFYTVEEKGESIAKNATNFSGADNLVIAHLANLAFAKETELRAAARSAAKAEGGAA
jgi:hypothetical protein